MKILLVHEFYRSSSPSGEDAVFRKEADLLARSGQHVRLLSFANDAIGTPAGPSLFRTALSTPWSLMGRKMVRDTVRRFRPDVVHFHNTFPVFSQAALWEARKSGAAVVQTLHNYRWFCANGLLLRGGTVCDICLYKPPVAALRHRCYRGSLTATLPLVVNIVLHRLLQTARRAVDQLVVLTPFAKRQLTRLGIPGDLVSVKPNFFDDFTPPGESPNRWEPGRAQSWIFVGRLKEEKGVQLLPRVWERLGPHRPLLRIVGDGPLRERIASEIQSRGLENVLVLEGLQPPSRVQELLKTSGLLVFPTLWYEGFPLTLGEAYAAGVPVAGSRIGAVESLVREGRTGVLFRPGDVEDMAAVLRRLLEEPARLEDMGRKARREYEEHYTPDRNLSMLLEIYQKAMARRNAATKKRKGGRSA
ncbi:MAG: glycosyltransferase family 4 protein [Desulfosoma sp.]